MRRGLLLAAAALALGAAKAPPAAPRLLGGDALDPALVLPPPPADDSAETRADLATLHAIDRTRTPAEADAAKADGKIKSVALFADAIGPGFDPARLPATVSLFDTVRAEEKAAVDRAKDHFRRNRPWIADPGLHACAADDAPQSSYPSGHTAMAFAMAGILARLVPTKAPAILARAAAYGRNRIVCEQHFAGDVAAGEAFGLVIAERLLAQPSFRVRYAAAAAELAAARLR